MNSDDLRRQLDTTLAGIRELDEDLAAGRLSAADHAELKQRSERQGAALLRRLRDSETAAAAKPPEKEGRVRLEASLRSPLALTFGSVVLLVAGVLIGVLLGRSPSDVGSRPRVVANTGTRVSRGAGVSPDLEALQKEIARDEAPTQKILEFAHRALDQGYVPAAIDACKRVLAREPKNVEAITHIGVILYQGGHVEPALARVDEAIATDPTYSHAHWDRAQILFNGKQDYGAAAAALEAFIRLVPTGVDADRARAMLTKARERAGNARGVGRGSGPMPAKSSGPAS